MPAAMTEHGGGDGAQALSCRSQVRKAAIAAVGAIPLLGAMLQSGNEDDKEVAALVLLNLSCCQKLRGDGRHHRASTRNCHLRQCPRIVALLGSLRRAPEKLRFDALLPCGDADDVRSSVVSQTFEHGGVAPLAAMLGVQAPMVGSMPRAC